jgi:uncharacterized protein (TIGR02466 family)
MAFSEPDVHVMFPVPLVTVRVTDADKLNARLLKEIASRRETEPGVERSNRYGWHSDLDLFARKEPAHAELARKIDRIVAAASAKLIPEMPEHLVIRHEGWINASPCNAMNAPHDHPGVFWSGSYYIRVPAPADADDTLSGAIEFIDPRGSIGTTARIEAPFTAERFTVRPAAGMCLLWPGFVKHWVHPNRAEEERVSAAFNSWFVRRS